MSISCAMKDPKSATVREFQFNGKAIAVFDLFRTGRTIQDSHRAQSRYGSCHSL